MERSIVFNVFLIIKINFGQVLAMKYAEYGLKTRVNFGSFGELPLMG